MKKYQRSTIPFILVGNKSDLRNEDSVKKTKACEYAKQLSEGTNFDIPYFEASAINGFNVDSLFSKLVVEADYANETQM